MTFLRPLPFFVRLFGWFIFALLVAGHWLPAKWQEPLFNGFAQSIIVGLVFLGLLWQTGVKTEARAFLFRLCLACFLWVCTEIETVLSPLVLPPGAAKVLEELGFFSVYLVFLWAIEATERRFKPVSWLDTIAAPLFVLGLSSYLLVIPLFVAPAEYDTFLPSHLFYVFMDGYLLIRTTALMVNCELPAWRQLLWLWCWAYGGLMLVDLLDMAWFFDVFETVYSDAWQGAYLLPMLPAMAFSGWSVRFLRWQAPAQFPRWLKETLRREARIIGFTLLPLVIHLIGYRIGIFDESVRGPREWFLTAWVFGGFILLQLYRKQGKAQPELAPTFVEPIENTATEIAEALTNFEAEGVVNDSDSQLMVRVDQVLEQHYGEAGFDVEAMSTALAISSRQLQRRIKTITEVSPADYLRRFRLIKAAELLRQGHKVAFVAAMTGFQQQSHFGRCFKELYGVTPGQFAQNNKNSVE